MLETWLLAHSLLFLQPYVAGVLAGVSLLALDLGRRRIPLRQIPALPRLAILDLLPAAVTAGLMAITIFHAALLRLPSFPSAAILIVVFCLLALAAFWSEGRKQIQFQRPEGLIFAEWLVAMSCLWILLAARLRPVPLKDLPSGWFAMIPLVAGVAIIVFVVPGFHRKYEGLRILERVANNEQFAQPEYTPATAECPQPQLWSMLDSQSTELEVLEFLKTLVTTVKPKLILETGTFLGHGTVKLAEGIRENGFGRVITIEFDPAIRARAQQRFHDSGLSTWIESRLESSLETQIEGSIDLFYSDSHLANREAEIRRLLPQLDPRGLLVIHDASSHFKIVREAALRMEEEGLISVVMLPTPRGVVVAQRREGRQ